jgi:hypothetical protein
VEIAALLELLYSAPERSRTVRATVERRNNQAREIELMRGRGLYPSPPPIPREEGEWATPAAVVEVTTRLWSARPDWLRGESRFEPDSHGNGETIIVKEGELFWQRAPDGHIHTNEGREGRETSSMQEERLLDPAPLLGEYRFEIGGETSRLGRAAVEVIAKRRAGAHPHDFGGLADELALVVDRERGVLLRVAVVVAGEELSVAEITEIAFDEPLPTGVFQRPTGQTD